MKILLTIVTYAIGYMLGDILLSNKRTKKKIIILIILIAVAIIAYTNK